MQEHDLVGTYRRLGIFAADGEVEVVTDGEALTKREFDDVPAKDDDIKIPIALRNIMDNPPARGKLGIGRPRGTPSPRGGIMPSVHRGPMETSYPFGSDADCEAPLTVDLTCPIGAQNRTFTANLQAILDDASAPKWFYLVAEIQWNGATGTKNYIDRDTSEFNAAGARVPAGSENRVVAWGEFATEISETQVGFAKPFTIRLHDQDGAIRGIIGGDAQQDSVVKVWLMFDDASTVWPTDAGLLYVGSIDGGIRFDESTGIVSLQISDRLAGVTRNVGKLAEQSVFANIAIEHRDHAIPIAWG